MACFTGANIAEMVRAGIQSIHRWQTEATRKVVTTSLQPFELWIVCALLYLVLTFSLSMLFQYFEKRILAR